jgi:hemoglobin
MRHIATLALVFAVALPAFAGKEKEKTLFHRLGAKKGVTKVVDDFVSNCASDPRIQRFFAATAADKKRLARFKKNLVDQLCEVAGGPCKYKGKDMATAHKGMGIQESDFNALVENLVKSLDKHQVAEADKQTLLGIFGPMKDRIVEPKTM